MRDAQFGVEHLGLRVESRGLTLHARWFMRFGVCSWGFRVESRLLWFWTQMRAKTDLSEAEILIATSKALAEVTTYLESDYAAFEVSICLAGQGGTSRKAFKSLRSVKVESLHCSCAPTLGKSAFHLT